MIKFKIYTHPRDLAACENWSPHSNVLKHPSPFLLQLLKSIGPQPRFLMTWLTGWLLYMIFLWIIVCKDTKIFTISFCLIHLVIHLVHIKKLWDTHDINRRKYTVKISNQKALLVLPLKFQQDLKNSCIDTLANYAIYFKYIETLPLKTELDLEIMKLMWVIAAKCIQIQCANEYV